MSDNDEVPLQERRESPLNELVLEPKPLRQDPDMSSDSSEDDSSPESSDVEEVDQAPDNTGDAYRQMEEMLEIRRRNRLNLFNMIFFMIWLANMLVAFTYYGVLSLSTDYNTEPEAIIPTDILKNFLSRAAWDYRQDFFSNTPKQYTAEHVAIVQTDTEICEMPDNCADLLIDIERKNGTLQYNFVLTPDGYIYEVLGWNEPSPMFEEVPTIVVAFLGNYETKMPTPEQLDQLRALITKSQQLEYLAQDFIMYGKKTKEVPVKLFECLAEWEEWNHENSDSDLVFINEEPYYIFEI